MTDPYRLTFNKPAVAQLLQTDAGETADGLRVRIEDNTAQFLPVRGSTDGDVLKLSDRSRGGVEATIEGSMAADLAAALKNDTGPFHTLRRVGGGWVQAVPHGKAEAPSKFTPHVRVWDSDFVARPKLKKSKSQKGARASTAMPTAPAAASGPLNIGQMFDRLRDAKNTLERFGTEKRRGQPPREVREAREAVAAFERNALDFLPEISEAHALLHGIIARGDVPGAKRRKAETAVVDTPEPVATVTPSRRRSGRKGATAKRPTAKAAQSAAVATA